MDTYHDCWRLTLSGVSPEDIRKIFSFSRIWYELLIPMGISRGGFMVVRFGGNYSKSWIVDEMKRRKIAAGFCDLDIKVTRSGSEFTIIKKHKRNPRFVYIVNYECDVPLDSAPPKSGKLDETRVDVHVRDYVAPPVQCSKCSIVIPPRSTSNPGIEMKLFLDKFPSGNVDRENFMEVFAFFMGRFNKQSSCYI